jgi:hypothetical protein
MEVHLDDPVRLADPGDGDRQHLMSLPVRVRLRVVLTVARDSWLLMASYSLVVILMWRYFDLCHTHSQRLIRDFAWRILAVREFLKPVRPVRTPLCRVGHQAVFVSDLDLQLLEAAAEM